MPEEDQDHGRDDEHLEDQLVLERLHRARDEIGGSYVVTIRTPGGSEPRGRAGALDRLDHVEYVLAAPHDHDAADVIAEAVEVRDAAAQLRPQLDARDVAHEHGHAACARREHDAPEVLDAARVAVRTRTMYSVPLHSRETRADFCCSSRAGTHDRRSAGRRRRGDWGPR